MTQEAEEALRDLVAAADDVLGLAPDAGVVSADDYVSRLESAWYTAHCSRRYCEGTAPHLAGQFAEAFRLLVGGIRDIADSERALNYLAGSFGAAPVYGERDAALNRLRGVLLQLEHRADLWASGRVYAARAARKPKGLVPVGMKTTYNSTIRGNR